MNKCVITLLWVCVLVCACAPLSWTQNDDGAARTRILALEHAWDQAEAVNDIKSLDSLFDNSMVYVDSEGTLMTKAEFLSRAKSARPAKVVIVSTSVLLFGHTAIATGIYEAHILKAGKPRVERGRFVDTWISRNATWVCISAQAIPIQR